MKNFKCATHDDSLPSEQRPLVQRLPRMTHEPVLQAGPHLPPIPAVRLIISLVWPHVADACTYIYIYIIVAIKNTL